MVSYLFSLPFPLTTNSVSRPCIPLFHRPAGCLAVGVGRRQQERKRTTQKREVYTCTELAQPAQMLVRDEKEKMDTDRSRKPSTRHTITRSNGPRLNVGRPQPGSPWARTRQHGAPTTVPYPAHPATRSPPSGNSHNGRHRRAPHPSIKPATQPRHWIVQQRECVDTHASQSFFADAWRMGLTSTGSPATRSLAISILARAARHSSVRVLGTVPAW